METALTEPLYMGVDVKRFLREVPAFFQSFEDALAELVQNAYRAGATKIDIRLDLDNRILEVKDDGRGCGDPRNLVTAGMTGWDEDVVVDPAGLGLFALLGLSHEVVIETRGYRNDGYRLRLTQECFSGKPLEVEELPWGEGPELHGLHIIAKIGEKAKVDVSLRYKPPYRTFRHFFPIDVNFTRIENGAKISYNLPPVELNTPYVDTPVGRIYHAPKVTDSSYKHSGVVAVWEHRTLSMPNDRALFTEITNLVGGSFAKEVLEYGHYLWVVNEASGVRPKLPDRRELINDENYTAALKSIAAALMDAFDVAGIAAQVHEMELEAELPEGSNALCEASQVLKRNLKIHPFFQTARFGPEIALQVAGYQKIKWDILENWETTWEDDYCSISLPEVNGYFRHPLRTNDPELAEVLCRGKVYTQPMHRGDDLVIKVEGAKLTDTPAGVMGIAESIKVYEDGKLVGSLQLFTPMCSVEFEADGVDYDSHAYIIVGEPEQLMDRVRESDWGAEWKCWALQAIDHAGRLDVYTSGDDGDGEVYVDQLQTEVMGDLMKLFYPAVGRSAERYVALHGWANDFNRSLHDLRWSSKRLTELVEKYPELKDEFGKLDGALQTASTFSIYLDKWEPRVQGADS